MTKSASQSRESIQDVARELFTQKGVQRTSLQDIADRLGVTKPALYHHFKSRDDLVRSIIQPLIDEGERFVIEHEQRSRSNRATPRELLEGSFDLFYRHRGEWILIVTELTTVADLGLIDAMLAWRDRFSRLVFGRTPTLAQSTRAVIAFGGLQDCVLQFPDTPRESLKRATVDGAMAALGL